MRGAVSDVLILGGVAALGWFCWLTWSPGIWILTGLVAIVYGYRLGVADANSRAQD